MDAVAKDHPTPMTMNVNGKSCQIEPDGRTLLEVLREDLRLTGTKKACDNGECGSCIVMMNGKPQSPVCLGRNALLIVMW